MADRLPPPFPAPHETRNCAIADCAVSVEVRHNYSIIETFEGSTVSVYYHKMHEENNLSIFLVHGTTIALSVVAINKESYG